jgi:2-haloacid dehalogenase
VAAGLTRGPARGILLDLLMATMDSMTTWSSAAGDPERGLAWRDAVTQRMIEAGRYVPYHDLVIAAAAELHLPRGAPDRLRDAWTEMSRWPDAGALESIGAPYAFVTNSSRELADEAVARSRLRPAFTLSAEEAGWYKPHPEVYRRACDRMGTDLRETCFVAGAPYDARGAARAGLRSVLVARRAVESPLPDEIAVVSSLEVALAGL